MVDRLRKSIGTTAADNERKPRSAPAADQQTQPEDDQHDEKRRPKDQTKDSRKNSGGNRTGHYSRTGKPEHDQRQTREIVTPRESGRQTRNPTSRNQRRTITNAGAASRRTSPNPLSLFTESIPEDDAGPHDHDHRPEDDKRRKPREPARDQPNRSVTTQTTQPNTSPRHATESHVIAGGK